MKKTAASLSVLALCVGLSVSLSDAHAKPETRVKITTSPPGAEVFHVTIDGEESLGITPIDAVKLPRGTQTLRIDMEGYEELLEAIDIGKQPESFLFNLLRLVPPAQVRVTTSAAFKGARLKVDGKVLGALPLSIKLAPGRHQLVVHLNGYKKWIRWIEPAAGEKLVFEVALHPDKRRGALMVASTPSDAQVRLNQATKGKTPLALDDLPVDVYWVEVTKAGFLPWKKTVTVTSGKRVVIDAVLQPASHAKSLLKVRVDLDKAEIYLDGRLIGMAPELTVEVAPGDHRIEIRPAQGERREKKLRIDKDQELEVIFRYQDAAPKEPTTTLPKKSPSPAPPGVDAPKQPAPGEAPTRATGTAFPQPLRGGAVTMGLGYPFILEANAAMGFSATQAIAVEVRSTPSVLSEFEVGLKTTHYQSERWAFASTAHLGGGLGGEGRNTFLAGASAILSRVSGGSTADPIVISGHLGMTYYNDRTGRETLAKHRDRKQEFQILIGASALFPLWKEFQGVIKLEGDPFGLSPCKGLGRCMYDAGFLADTRFYGQAGVATTF